MFTWISNLPSISYPSLFNIKMGPPYGKLNDRPAFTTVGCDIILHLIMFCLFDTANPTLPHRRTYLPFVKGTLYCLTSQQDSQYSQSRTHGGFA